MEFANDLVAQGLRRYEDREGLQVLEPFLAESVRTTMDPQRGGRLLGNLGIAYKDFGQVEKAIGLLEQALCIGREIKDPQIIRVCTAQLERLTGDGEA